MDNLKLRISVHPDPLRKQTPRGEKLFVTHITKSLYPRHIKTYKSITKTDNTIEKRAKHLSKHFTKEEIPENM